MPQVEFKFREDVPDDSIVILTASGDDFTKSEEITFTWRGGKVADVYLGRFSWSPVGTVTRKQARKFAKALLRATK